MNNLLTLTIEELERQISKAEQNANEEYWKFTRCQRVNTDKMSETSTTLFTLRLIKKYFKYINAPIQVVNENNNGCLFSHKLDTVKKIQTLDRIIYKNKGSKIIMLGGE